MKNNQVKIVDESGLHLLAHGCHVLLGMPVYGVKNCATRKTSPLSPEELVGLSGSLPYGSILDDYEHMYGYNFSWGTVSETMSEAVEEEELPTRVNFEFASRDVYLAFPEGWHLVDLFSWLYQRHPLRHRKFAPGVDGTTYDWSVISFEAEGERKIKTLRAWMAKVFIPLIWPDLLGEAIRIIEERKETVVSQDGLEELLMDQSRYLLCGDPKALSFYKAASKAVV